LSSPAPATFSPFHSPRRCGFLALVLGAASVAAFAPLGIFFLVWLTLAGFFLLLEKADSAREGAWLGFLFGLGWFGAGVSWIYVSISVFGGLAMPVAALATVCFCAVMATFPALAGFLYRLWRARRDAVLPLLSRALLFAALWALCEFLRGWVATGFPWLAAGYAQTPPSPLSGYAPILGVHGLSLLTAFLAALIAAPFRERGPLLSPPLILAFLILLGGAGLSRIEWTHPHGEPVSVALVQGNIEQSLKWDAPHIVDSLRAYYQLMREHPAQLTLFPETALPGFVDEFPQDYFEALKTLALRQNGDLLFGAILGERERPKNGAISLGASPQQQYAKAHLVPFGEFTPPGFSWFMSMMNIPMSQLIPGEEGVAPLLLAGQRVAVDICYEDVFGEEIARSAADSTLLANLSNTAWFGDSLAQPQHLQIARIRALETGRPILRATNTGMTAVIHPDGSVAAVLPPFTCGVLIAAVQGRAGSTPYLIWKNGAFLFLAGMALLLARAGKRRTSKPPNPHSGA